MKPKKYWEGLWILFGASYGLIGRFLLPHAPAGWNLEILSFAFLCATPVTIGAIVVYGLRDSALSVWRLIWAPWLSILLALVGSMVALLEGSICIILAAPLFLVASSLGGLVMGLLLRWLGKSKATLNGFLVLPLMLFLIEPPLAQKPIVLEERVAVNVDATPQRIWSEIKNARSIRRGELAFSVAHLIGVPRPLEGYNIATTLGEVRFSKWERGVNFSAEIVEQVEHRSITWRYRFTPNSFPSGSLDDHVTVGGKYFNLYDTTFNLVPLSPTETRLEIISHYSVTTGVNFYGIPVARFIAQDFMNTIVKLYKTRSEKQMTDT